MNYAFVKARVPGELQALTLREGDAVRAGQVVARVDPMEAQARLKQAQQQADAAKAQIDIAERQYNNNKALVDQGFISRSALDTSWSNLAAAQANHKAALAAVDVTRKSLDDTVLRAPISGVVAQRLAQPGERVAVDSRVIEIVDLARLELEATLSASDSIDVRVGQDARLQVEGSPRTIPARVARINPSAQPGSRSVVAYLSLGDTTGLRQGLFAQGTLALRARGDARGAAVGGAHRQADAVRAGGGKRQGGAQGGAAGARGESGDETWVAVQGWPRGRW